MDATVIGAATVSISGAILSTASVWGLVAALTDLRGGTSGAAAARVHALTGSVIVIAGLVTHVLGYFPEAFVLIYAGGASSLVAAASAARSGARRRVRSTVPTVLTIVGLVVLTVGLLV
ncbi:hypothetical protein [Curtobacterium aetherium]|uniref:Uncharacterized protein n=1 Tax=Curtobacterium aetherium TaxID=2841594 RepID=A0ACD1E1R7_9MICO|nr:hypothetical protein [Curtobacterium sp. L6-1]QWS32752.1 hypothetical protein KM842_10750 [Curtobacterium sp. L6-1]